MGNDQSDLKRFVIDNKSIETTKYWTLHYAEVNKNDPSIFVSVFRSVLAADNQVGSFFHNHQSPLSRAIRVKYLDTILFLRCETAELKFSFAFLPRTEFKNLSSPIATKIYLVVERRQSTPFGHGTVSTIIRGDKTAREFANMLRAA